MISATSEIQSGAAPHLKLLRPGPTAKLLDVSEGTLAVWRSTGRYPLPYVKMGGSIRYRLTDIQQFIEARTRPGDGSGSGPHPNRRRRRRRSSPRS